VLAGSAVAGGSSVGAAGAVGATTGLAVGGAGVAVLFAPLVGSGGSLGVDKGIVVGGSGVAVAVGAGASVGGLVGVGLGALVGRDVAAGSGAGLGALVGRGVAAGSGAGLGSVVGADAIPVGVFVAPGAPTSVGDAVAEATGSLGKRASMAAGSTITVALVLSDGAFEALIVILLVHGPGTVAVKVTSITIKVFGASEPMLASVKPPGDRHPPPTTSVSTTFSAGASPRFP
jgi:hypothetical protein